VRDVHEMRTRKTGDLALVDAHILVEPFISVSEGHFIAESARTRVLTDARVLDALIHVDPEDDMHVRSVSSLPPREALVGKLREAFAAYGEHVEAVTLHYLSTGLAVQVSLAAGDDMARLAEMDLEAIKRSIGASRLDVVHMVSADAVAATRGEAAGTPRTAN
jgi:hypothetical protein